MAEILIYDVIGEDMFGEGTTAGTIRNALDTADGDDVTVRINSPGGNVFDGIAIKNILDSYSGKVSVRVDGLAASAASVIALAGESVEMADGAMLMIHDPWTLTIGNEADHQETIHALGKIAESLAGMYARRAGGDASPESMRELMQAETWLVADEAMALGLADSKSDCESIACNVPKAFCYKNQQAEPTKPDENATAKRKLTAAARQRQIDLTRAQMNR